MNVAGLSVRSCLVVMALAAAALFISAVAADSVSDAASSSSWSPTKITSTRCYELKNDTSAGEADPNSKLDDFRIEGTIGINDTILKVHQAEDDEGTPQWFSVQAVRPIREGRREVVVGWRAGGAFDPMAVGQSLEFCFTIEGPAEGFVLTRWITRNYAGVNQSSAVVSVSALVDPDGDGRASVVETDILGSNPSVSDTDGDGVSDGSDTCVTLAAVEQADDDGDGLGNPCDPTPNARDPDNDELDDFDEVLILRTNPLVADSDGDGFTDGTEAQAISDPLRASSVPEACDGIDNDGDGLVDDGCEAVGGEAGLLDDAAPPAETESASSVAPLAPIAATVAAGVLALGGGVWYARRRWVR